MKIVGVIALASVVALVALIVAGGTNIPDGPVPIAWDRSACAHCHMAVGEPRYAVQLITADGAVFDFDDVACAVDYIKEHQPSIHRLWFHGEGDTWHSAEAVGFVRTAVTPMGSGLMAVDRQGAEVMTFEELMRASVTERRPPRGRP